MEEAGRLAAAGETQQALAKLQEASRLAPQDWRVENMRGGIHTSRQEWGPALEAFNRAIILAPKEITPRYNLGELYFQQGSYAKARERFESILPEDPANEFLQYKIFLAYLLDNRRADAEVKLAAFNFAGKTPAYYFAHAAWEFKNGDAEKGWSWLDSAQKIYPENQIQFFSESLVRAGLAEGQILQPESETEAKARDRRESGSAQ
jgi:tetratricopeptide (TPR) repeat protein